VAADERGISEAIARSMADMSLLPVPIVSAVIGEGGSGGALGIAVADRILILEHAVYSVIPPEGCAAILWRDADQKAEAAKALNLTAEGALRLGVVDEIVPEPLGGAHRDWEGAAAGLRTVLHRHLGDLLKLTPDALIAGRYEKVRRTGRCIEFGPDESAGEDEAA